MNPTFVHRWRGTVTSFDTSAARDDLFKELRMLGAKTLFNGVDIDAVYQRTDVEFINEGDKT